MRGREAKTEGYTYVQREGYAYIHILIVVQQKTTQHCKATILHRKITFKKSNWSNIKSKRTVESTLRQMTINHNNANLWAASRAVHRGKPIVIHSFRSSPPKQDSEPKAFSFQRMTEFTTNKNKKKNLK